MNKRYYCAGGECIWLDPLLADNSYSNWVDCTSITREELADFVDSKRDRAAVLDAYTMDVMVGITKLKPAELIELHEMGISHRLERNYNIY